MMKHLGIGTQGDQTHTTQHPATEQESLARRQLQPVRAELVVGCLTTSDICKVLLATTSDGASYPHAARNRAVSFAKHDVDPWRQFDPAPWARVGDGRTMLALTS